MTQVAHSIGDDLSRLGEGMVNQVARTLAAAGLAKPLGDIFSVIGKTIQLSEAIPGLGAEITLLSTTLKMVTDVAAGRFNAAAAALDEGARILSDAVGIIPGLGTPLAIALNDALTILEGGSPLLMALDSLLSLPPLSELPESWLQALRLVFEHIDRIVEGKESITDAFISTLPRVIRTAIPGVPESIVNDAVQLVVALLIHHVPVVPLLTNAAATVAGNPGAIPLLTAAVTMAGATAKSRSRLAEGIAAGHSRHAARIVFRAPRPGHLPAAPPPVRLSFAPYSPTVTLDYPLAGTLQPPSDEL